MSENGRLADSRAAREKFESAVRDMERFILNLDPGRGQFLRDWIRAVADEGQSGAPARPPLAGWPLAEQLGEHVKAVLAARTALRKARPLARRPPA